jgi:hypothetical protein
MAEIYEFEPKPAEPKMSKKIEKAQEDPRPLIDRLDPISKEMFEKGPEAAYNDFYGRKRKNSKVKIDEKACLDKKSDDEIVKELDGMYREVVASAQALFQAYKERIMGKEGK